MEFNCLKKVGLVVIFGGLLNGCSDLHVKDDWWKGTSGLVQSLARKDCEVYNSSSSQYDECTNQIDTFYKENY